MSPDKDSSIRIKPFVQGVTTKERTIIRSADSPDYLSLSHKELSLLKEMSTQPLSVQNYLISHLDGRLGLTFREAVSLLVQLHGANLLERSSIDGSIQRLKELARQSRSFVHQRTQWLLTRLSSVLDLPVLEFENTKAGTTVSRIGAAILSGPGCLIFTLLTFYLLSALQNAAWFSGSALSELLHRPEVLLLEIFAGFSVACSSLSLFQIALLTGGGAQFVPASLRLTGFCILRLAVHNEDAFLFPRPQVFRYWTLTILAPWLCAGLIWKLAVPAFAVSGSSVLACAFAIVGMGMLCPLYRSPLVKLMEGMLSTLNIVETANLYLNRGLFRSLLPTGRTQTTQALRSRTYTEKALEVCVAVFASISLFWLYGVDVLFAGILLRALPALYGVARLESQPLRQICAALALIGLASGVLLLALRLVLILCQNVASVAVLPLRKARRSIDSYLRSHVTPSAAQTAFLREIPLLAHLGDEQITGLTPKLGIQHYRRGQEICKQGEVGAQFYILASGEAQVFVEKRNRLEDMVGVLHPGDSFGEIALLERSPRTATVRASAPSTLFILEKADFDLLFPENSDERKTLTQTIRRIKLIQESQVLSHLLPSQIRDLLRSCETAEFPAGDLVAREGGVGEAAYLIEDGRLRIYHQDLRQPIAVLGRGELVGVISLVKDVRRTADVIAETHVTALKIDKETFLRICLANLYVGMLVSDLSDKQVQELKAS